MVPLVEAIEEQSGQKPEKVLADNGYCSDENLKYLARKRMEGFVATGKQKHSQRREPCKRGPLPREASQVERMESVPLCHFDQERAGREAFKF
jgi:hypothetical protein